MMTCAEGTHPDVQIAPQFMYDGSVDSFLKEKTDILFFLKEQTKRIPGMYVHNLFTSQIYLIALYLNFLMTHTHLPMK